MGSCSLKLCVPGQNSLQYNQLILVKQIDSDPFSCNPNDKLCRQDVQEVKPTYYDEILNTCNGYRTCNSLVADWGEMSQCQNKLSDYVEIFYKCIRGKEHFFQKKTIWWPYVLLWNH